MFTILFCHLTTTIPEIELNLQKSTSLRAKVPRNLMGFKKLVDATKDTLVEAKSQSQEKRRGRKETRGDADKEYQDELAECPAFKAKAKDNYETFVVDVLSMNLPNFFYQWESNYLKMKLTKYEHSHRLAPRRGERMLVMSGLSWNESSNNRPRDWMPTVAAITLETGIVEMYREDMLRRCAGARKLREEMETYFLSIASFFVPFDRPTEPQAIKEWRFPDGYSSSPAGEAPAVVPASSTGPATESRTASRTALTTESTTESTTMSALRVTKYNPDVIRKELNRQNPMNTKQSKKRDKLRTSIDGLVKNKLLWADKQGDTGGTLETLAYHCIAALSRVSHHSFMVSCVLLGERQCRRMNESLTSTWTDHAI